MKGIKHVVLLILIAVSANCVARDTWKGVERIVAIGDLHGDYQQFEKAMKMSGLINDQGAWTGGRTHLVQTGDIPDRGPESLKIIRTLQRLEKEARRQKGYVHALIGNHEAMNVYGDLRYVHEDEYHVLVTRDSSALQENYYTQFTRYLSTSSQETVFDEDFKTNWMKTYPLGYVEHRRAWQPGGSVANWVTAHNTVIKINNILFVHGGLDPHRPPKSIREINKVVSKELQRTPLPLGALAEADNGPLWYRGLAQNPEETEREPTIEMLRFYGADHIVMGHSPTRGVINPRFDRRVIVIDVGMAEHYGRGMAVLEIENGQFFALHRGTRVALPKKDSGLKNYFEAISVLEPNPIHIKNIIEKIEQIEQSQALPVAKEALAH